MRKLLKKLHISRKERNQDPIASKSLETGVISSAGDIAIERTDWPSDSKLQGQWKDSSDGHASDSTPSTQKASASHIAKRTSQPPESSSVILKKNDPDPVLASPVIRQEPQLQISPLSHCSICHSLNVLKVPASLTGSDWARKEYNVAAGTPSTKLIIRHSQLLVGSQTGCVFCNLLCNSLNAMRPGWETQDSYIELYLALNLPVIARWVNGSITTTSGVWNENLGFNAHWTIQAKGRKQFDGKFEIEPDVEFEIYRPETLQSVDKQNTALGPLVNHIGTAGERSGHPAALECFNFITHHLTKCMQEHDCGRRIPPLPDRVVWIKPDNTGDIKLVEPQNVHAHYIALSYCWGPVGHDTLLTNTTTFAKRKAGIKVAELPPQFVSIIRYARMLRIDYIWIDRLCIIQGDEKDFATQAPKMGQYYGNATLTFATASVNSEMDDPFVVRDPRWSTSDATLSFGPLGSLSLGIRRRQYLLGTEAKGGDYGKVSTRAWIWQERLLAARTIFFTPAELKFECHHHSVWESYSSSLTSPSWSSRIDKITPLDWLILVEEFTKREITRSSDRLPAISSVMQRIAKPNGWVPVWGMWREFLGPSLGWSASDSGKNYGKHVCSMHSEYLAPSWSWASIEGLISYINCKPAREEFERSDPHRTVVEVMDVDSVSGVLTIRAPWAFVDISCHIEEDVLDQSPTPRIQHLYCAPTVKFLGEKHMTRGMGFSPDVALQPAKSRLSPLENQTTMRVPYGEKIPQDTWTSKCLCILLGHNRVMATVLLLGESQRIPHAYERIGIAGSWPREMFAAIEPHIFGIA